MGALVGKALGWVSGGATPYLLALLVAAGFGCWYLFGQLQDANKELGSVTATARANEAEARRVNAAQEKAIAQMTAMREWEATVVAGNIERDRAERMKFDAIRKRIAQNGPPAAVCGVPADVLRGLDGMRERLRPAVDPHGDKAGPPAPAAGATAVRP